MNDSLAQFKVLVTGGAVRIGRAITEVFAHAGASVRIHCNKSLTEAEALCSALPTAGEVVCLDLAKANDDDLQSLVMGIDVLINNASVFFPEGTFEELRKGEVEEQLRLINYEVPLRLMELFAESNSSGEIINMLDAAVMKPDAVFDAYSQSKFLLYLATRIKALEYAPEIRVNGVAPGAVLPPAWLPDSLMEKSIAEMPLQKAPKPEDVAKTCLFLASTGGITGEIIKLDGGRHLL